MNPHLKAGIDTLAREILDTTISEPEDPVEKARYDQLVGRILGTELTRLEGQGPAAQSWERFSCEDLDKLWDDLALTPEQRSAIAEANVDIALEIGDYKTVGDEKSEGRWLKLMAYPRDRSVLVLSCEILDLDAMPSDFGDAGEEAYLQPNGKRESIKPHDPLCAELEIILNAFGVPALRPEPAGV
ncbi:MAG TPA: hypothetical protein VLG37_05825 [Candidatus Saccharimonadales bacterium]|nr:hypothetical protein [Candidatus Saccharimonadales bacterium]